MIYLFLRKNKKETSVNREFLKQFWSTHSEDRLPKVTTQLPVYNERHVVERLIKAVVNIDYPKSLHEIQVLDDSNDETKGMISGLVNKYREMGFNIKHIVRNNRDGFKAGALNLGLEKAEGEFLSIFDADFVPDKNFLYETIPFFYERPKVALVQTRWGHINRNYSLLTIAQSIGMDGHFIIEQGARAWNGLYMNFTAGIYIEEKTKYFPIVTIAGATVNVAVNFTLIPILGIMGAAWATLASYIVMAIGLFIVSQKFYKIDYEYNKILKIFIIITITACIYYFYNEVMNIGIRILIFAMFIFALFGLRIIKKDELIRTLKSFRRKRKIKV